MKYYKFKKTKKYKFYNWLHEKTFSISNFLGYYSSISLKHFENVETEWNAQNILVSFFPIKMGILFRVNKINERCLNIMIKQLLNNQ